MPGIVGIITRCPQARAEAELLRMLATLQHEPFYQSGTWTDPSAGIYAAWVAREGSFSSGMPIINERGDVVLLFSGEEYSAPDTARRLKEHGHQLDQGEASYLVHLYEEEPTFPASLNGRFHGLLIDRRRGTAILFNDRYGMHRVYYHHSIEAFYFAAEAKAILAVQPELRSIDYRALGEYVACGCVLENRSLFRNIHLVPPASAWAFRNGSVDHEGAYFQPRQWEEQEPLEPDAYYDTLKDVFSRTLSSNFQGRQRVAMSLTGGLDSRMIMAWQTAAPGALPCYTFGGDDRYRQCQDALIAQKVATLCGQTHETIPVGRAFLNRFDHYAERTVYLTDGCVAPTYSPDLYLNERARAIAPVRITGNYGSEVLRRSRAFKPKDAPPAVFSADLQPHIERAGATYYDNAACHPISFAVFRQAPWHHHGLLSLEESQLTLRSPYLDNDLVQTVFRKPDSVSDEAVCLRLIADGNPSLLQIATDRGLGGSRGSYSSTLRRFALEVLFKAEYAYDEGMPQWLARIDGALSQLRLERFFLGTHKFHHFRIWYRDELADYVRAILLDPRTLSRPFLKPRGIERIVAGHLKGTRNYTAEIHRLLALELLHRLFIDQAPTPGRYSTEATTVCPAQPADALQHR